MLAQHDTHDTLSIRMELKTRHFVILESLRGVAAMYVVLNHARGGLWIGMTETLNQTQPSTNSSATDLLRVASALPNLLTRMGYEFVILFFVLSGFSIAHSLRKKRPPTQFWLRRAIRLYPPYLWGLIWGGVAALFVLSASGSWARGYDVANYFRPDHVLGNLLYLNRGSVIAQYWSLAHEVVFYLLAPWLVVYWRTFVASSSVLFFVGAILNIDPNSLSLPVRIGVNFTLLYAFYFAIGVALYRNFDRFFAWFKKHSVRSWTIVLVVVFFAALGVNLHSGSTRLSQSLIAFGGVVSIALLIRMDVQHPALTWLGEQSYTLYVTHYATIILIRFFIQERLGVEEISWPYLWVLALPLVLLVSRLSFLAVEKPTRTILDKMRTQPRAPKAHPES